MAEPGSFNYFSQLPIDPEQKIKQPISQLVPETGVSNDYLNEISALSSYLGFDNGLVKVKQNLEIVLKPVKGYAERYPESEYLDVITPANEERIKAIDACAERINVLLSTLAETSEEDLESGVGEEMKKNLKALIGEMLYLVRG